MRSAESGFKMTLPMPFSQVGVEMGTAAAALVLIHLLEYRERLFRCQRDVADTAVDLQMKGDREMFVS